MNKKYLKNLIIKRKMSIILLSMLLAFMLFGNCLFVFPLNGPTSFISIIKYVIAAILISPICAGLIVFDERGIKTPWIYREDDVSIKYHYLKMFVVYLGITIVGGAVMLYAFNPAIVSWDDYEMLAEAYNLHPVVEYNLWYVCVYKVLLSICDSVTFVAFVQIVAYGVVLARIFVWMEKERGINSRILIILYLLITLLPNNAMMISTLTRDVYYALGIIDLTFCMARFYVGARKLGLYIEYAAALSWVILMKQTGIVVSLISAIAVVIFVRSKKIVISTLIAFICTGLVSGGLNRYFLSEKTAGGLKYVALYNDMLGVMYNGGDISEGTRELLALGVEDNADYLELYSPYWAYYDEYYLEIADVPVVDVLTAYIDTFFRNPILMTRIVLCRLDMLWDIPKGINGIETWQWKVKFSKTEYMELIGDRVPTRNENVMTKLIDFIGQNSVRTPIKEILWRMGVSTFFSCMFLIFLFRRNKRTLLIFIPGISFVLSYVIALGWTHYRYWWCCHILFIFYSLFYISAIGTHKND